MKNLFAIFLIMVFYQTSFSQSSGLYGRITNSGTGKPLAGATVSLENTTYTTVTGDNGVYHFHQLAPGSYMVTVGFTGFAFISKRVKIQLDKEEEINIELDVKATQLLDVTVYGKINGEEETGARQKEKKANNIINVISAKAMERSPDINAANVLQRMSGLTIQRNGGGDEAYPVIRGLDPRYSNTLINGIKITSPDDKSRFVPLNLVPSDLLGSIEVHKSLLPEMEGDAIGGTVNLVMKDAPEKETFKVLASLGYNKIFMDRKFDYFSQSDIKQKSVVERLGSGYNAQPGDFSRSNLDFKQMTPNPNSVIAITYGGRFFKRRLGLMVAENFQNQFYGSNSVFNQAAPDIRSGQPVLSDFATRSFSTHQINNGITLHVDYNINDHNKIILTNTFLYSKLSQARTIVDTAILGGNGGRTVQGTGPVYIDYTSTTNQQILENIKLQGKHHLSKHLMADWTSVFSYAAKRAPDRVNLSINSKIDSVHTTNDINGPYTFISTPNYFDLITRIWQHNEDKDYSGLANLAWKNKVFNNGLLELKVGALYRHKVRFNIQDEYDLRPTTNSNGVKQEFININTAQWTVYNASGTYDFDVNKYKVYENVMAGYFQAKLTLHSFDIFGGVRMEKTKQGFKLNTIYATGINGVDKDYTDFLPSVLVKYQFTSISNLKVSYYKALARPNYYDLVPAKRYNGSDATSIQGNPYLNHSVADNIDIRYEIYPKEDEQFFMGLFYKKIKNPIEKVLVNGTTYEPINVSDANVYGAELAFTKYFGKYLGVTGNYTYLHSTVSSGKSYYNITTGYNNPDSLQKRSLQGQVDHTFNISLLFRSEKSKTFAELSLQYTGNSIGYVYNIYGYDYYQRPQINLSFSAEQQLQNKHFTLFTKFNNLLNTASKNEINKILLVNDIYKFNFSFGLRLSN